MASQEDAGDVLKGVDWKTVGSVVAGKEGQIPSATTPVKKRLPRKVRSVPDYYFLPRRSIPATIALYAAIGAAGVGAGMLVELWMNKKIEEDGGILWEMDES